MRNRHNKDASMHPTGQNAALVVFQISKSTRKICIGPDLVGSFQEPRKSKTKPPGPIEPRLLFQASNS